MPSKNPLALLGELKEERKRLDDEMDSLAARHGGVDNMDSWPEGQVVRAQNLGRAMDRVDDGILKLEAERAEKVDAVRSAASVPGGRETTFGSPDLVTRNHAGDPWREMGDSLARFDSATGLRERALTALEIVSEEVPDESRQMVAELLSGRDQDDPYLLEQSRATSEFVLATADPHYKRAFDKVLRNPTHGFLNWSAQERTAYSRTEAVRTAMSLTSANGGYLVPFTLDPTIALTNSGSANPFRQISNIKQTATNTWNGVTSAGVSAGWLAEGTEDTDHTPTFGNLQITPQKAAAWVYGSYEVLGDSDFAQQFPTLMADAKDRLEEAAFATGTGTGQPFGIVPRATTVTSIGAGAYAVGDVYATQQALPARFRGPRARPAWLANLAILNKTRQFDTAGGSSFWANLNDGQPEQLLGKPIYESTTMVGTITTGSKNLLFGDFSQYYIVDRLGMQVIYEPLVKGTANARPTGQAGWFAFWRVGADVTTTTAFRVLVEG